jgi:predicted metalloprotease
MRWRRGERSQNLEDRRGMGAGPMRMGMPRLGIGGIVLLLGISWLLGINPLTLLGGLTDGGSMPAPGDQPVSAQGPLETSAAEEEQVDFVSFVLDDAQTTWRQMLSGYEDAKLVLFRGAVDSGCGYAQAAMGPFYCPRDGKVYVDLGFFDELSRRFGAPGDFARAYVLAHEIGHHVQAQLGTESKMRQLQQQYPSRQNELSVRLELQADCYAGVWGHSTARRDILEQGDMEEGLAAAAAVGDDRIQEMATGGVHPESFTHGSSEQRMRWFRRGFESGDPNACDTFAN